MPLLQFTARSHVDPQADLMGEWLETPVMLEDAAKRVHLLVCVKTRNKVFRVSVDTVIGIVRAELTQHQEGLHVIVQSPHVARRINHWRAWMEANTSLHAPRKPAAPMPPERTPKRKCGRLRGDDSALVVPKTITPTADRRKRRKQERAVVAATKSFKKAASAAPSPAVTVITPKKSPARAPPTPTAATTPSTLLAPNKAIPRVAAAKAASSSPKADLKKARRKGTPAPRKAVSRVAAAPASPTATTTTTVTSASRSLRRTSGGGAADSLTATIRRTTTTTHELSLPLVVDNSSIMVAAVVDDAINTVSSKTPGRKRRGGDADVIRSSERRRTVLTEGAKRVAASAKKLLPAAGRVPRATRGAPMSYAENSPRRGGHRGEAFDERSTDGEKEDESSIILGTKTPSMTARRRKLIAPRTILAQVDVPRALAL